MPIEICVSGTPAPKGSSRAMLRGGKAVFVPGGSKINAAKLKAWAPAVADAARDAMQGAGAAMFQGEPLRMQVVFRIKRPAGHYGTGKNAGGVKASAPPWPSVKPDLDKLVRATCDAMSAIVYDDDSRIVEKLARKRWASPGEGEGAWIKIERMSDGK